MHHLCLMGRVLGKTELLLGLSHTDCLNQLFFPDGKSRRLPQQPGGNNNTYIALYIFQVLSKKLICLVFCRVV